MRGAYKPGPAVSFDASAGIREALQVIGRDADTKVPVGDSRFPGSGDLRDSQVIQVEGNRGGIGYRDGGAVPAHERMDVRPANGRQRKYLESAVNSNQSRVAEAIAADLRRQLGG